MSTEIIAAFIGGAVIAAAVPRRGGKEPEPDGNVRGKWIEDIHRYMRQN